MGSVYDEGITSFPCAVCGREFEPDATHRCNLCQRFACRECLKIHYQMDHAGNYLPTNTTCYDCYHSTHTKPYIEATE